jgi:hypothetical protein
MTDDRPLPLFETPADARRYLQAAGAIIVSGALVVVAVLAWLFLGSTIGVAGLLLALGFALAGQVLYLVLCAGVWARHRPNDPWDWRSARAFHEGSLTATIDRARRVARNGSRSR